MTKNLCILSILFMLLALPVLAFSADEKTFVAQTGTDGAQRVEITAGTYFFKPEHIIVKAGVPVELVIRNESKLIPHNFVMNSPEAGMDFSEQLSDSLTIIRFTPAVPGKYSFFCDKKLLFFKSHRDRGMEGEIEVRQD